jgi:uncharacterized membrane protein
VTLWRLARLGRRLVKRQLPAAAQTLREASDTVAELTDFARDYGFQEWAQQLRHVPVQLSIDVAVPLQVAYDQWVQLESLPEGDHRVQNIERRGQRLVGAIRRSGAVHEWEAEVRDERRDESFAWRSVQGSDVAGLITFHRIGERLTRLELALDIVPVSIGEALALTLHLSDRVAEADLRRFKLRVETISPDAYPASAHRADGRAPKRNNRANRRAAQGKARDGKSRNQRKEE